MPRPRAKGAPPFNPSSGIRLLTKWMESRSMDQGALAEKLSTDQPHVSRLLSGATQPSFATVAKLVELTGLAPLEFFVLAKAPARTSRQLLRRVNAALTRKARKG